MSPFVRPPTVRHHDRVTARSVAAILLAVFTLTMTGLPEHTDSEAEFQTTSALARGATFALGGTPESDAMVANRDVAPVRVGADGRCYSWFGVGQALAAVPLYYVGALVARAAPGIEEAHAETTYLGFRRSEYFQHLLVGWRNPLLSAATAWLLTLVARRLGVRRRVAWLAGLAYGLCTFAWPQARSTLSDVQATFFLFLAFSLLVRAREDYERTRRPAPLDLLLFGAALGGAFLTRVITAPAILVLLVSAFAVALRGARLLGARARPLADAAWAVGPAAGAVLLFLALNQVRFGDPFESGYGAPMAGGKFFSHPPHHGLAGLLISPGSGLLWLAPGVLLAPFGVAWARARGERLFPLTLLGVVVAVFGPIAFTATWHGAWTYGPRYVLPALPFLWVAVALALQSFEERPVARLVALFLFGVGLVTNLPGVLVDHMTHEHLADQAAELEWHAELEAQGLEGGNRAAARFELIQWDLRFAAPWAHWRIFRDRVSGVCSVDPDASRWGPSAPREVYRAGELFFLDGDAAGVELHPDRDWIRGGAAVDRDRDRGFRHLAWVDLARRLGGSSWPAWFALFGLLTAGVLLAARGMDPIES